MALALSGVVNIPDSCIQEAMVAQVQALGKPLP
jgi:hypothetical protein